MTAIGTTYLFVLTSKKLYLVGTTSSYDDPRWKGGGAEKM